MYIVIKNTTYKLKEFNTERRVFFVNNILSNYGIGSFDEQMQKIQEEVKRIYGVEISKNKAAKDFFREFDKLIYQTVWEFLRDEDKKEIGVIANLVLDEDEKVKFIEFYSGKVKQLSEMGSQDGQAVDAITIQTFIAKNLGRSIEEVAEMDELLTIELLKEIGQFIKEERAEKTNIIAVATAYGNGNKSAKSQIDKINSQAKRKPSFRNIKVEDLKESSNFSKDDFRRMLDGR